MSSLPLQGDTRLAGMVKRQPTDITYESPDDTLVYLIHGVTGTPVEMRFLARGLARTGAAIYATTLPGHCTTLRALVQGTEEQWIDHVCTQLAYARSRYRQLYVVGLSAGSLLALEAATRVLVEGVGVLSATFFYDGWNTPRTHAILPLLLALIPTRLQHLLFHLDGPPYGIKDPKIQAQIHAAYSSISVFQEWRELIWESPRAAAIRRQQTPSPAASKGYPLFPLRTLTEIHRLQTRLRAHLHTVSARTLILHAQDDDMTSPRNAQFVYDTIAAADKQLILLNDCYHVITADRQRKSVVTALQRFCRLSDFGQKARPPSRKGDEPTRDTNPSPEKVLRPISAHSATRVP